MLEFSIVQFQRLFTTMNTSKQVIVMKKFPKTRNMRIGKYCAQSCHASVAAILGLRDRSFDEAGEQLVIPLSNPFVKSWMLSNFKKVAVYVETDEELLAIYLAAKEAGLACSLITDSGLTEFNGVATLTAVGIGPDDEIAINKITGHLPLF
jgi:PTH2 family peptidyl-tRNA hydrolase